MKHLGIVLNYRSKKSVIILVLTVYFLFLMYLYQKPMTGVVESTKETFLFILLWFILSPIPLLEHRGVNHFLKKHASWVNGILFLVAPFLSFFMTEFMVGNYNKKMFITYGSYNIIWYFVIYLVIFAVLCSFKRAVILGNLIFYIAAMINYLVYLFRGNPILPSDILAWRTGMSVASSYELLITKDFIIATLIMYTLLSVGLRLEIVEKKPSVLHRSIALGVSIVVTSLVVHTFFETDLIQKKIRVIDFFAPKYTYTDYGAAFGFVANAWSMKVKAPEGYSAEAVKLALEEYAYEEEVDSKIRPNIIAIMNEAFSDLSMLGYYETNQDYLPFLRSLEENTTKGALHISVFGGATSNTEYEFLTGNSMAVMPSNCVPYQQFVTEPTDSLAATLKAQGYYNVAIHPFEPSGYKRDLVYPLLGFDRFLSKNDFVNPKLVRSYISDRESFQKIIEVFEEKNQQEPLFVFNVTMQNHGGYSSEQIFSEEETVRFTNLAGYGRVEQYLSLIRETDKAFQELIEYFSKVEEPTIILMFGDHQPVVYTDFYNELTDHNKVNELKYQVPFILWANYDISEDDVDKMSANYLSSYLLKTAGLQGTAYNNYLMDLYEDIPVINGLYYIDKADVLHRHADQTIYYNKIVEYQYIGYNNGLDKKNKLNKFFLLN